MAEVDINAGDASGELLSFRGDYESLHAEIEAVPEEKLLSINVPIPRATQTVLGSVDEILQFRQRIVEELPTFEIAKLDKLKSYTRAAYHANTLYSIASTPLEAVPELVAECSSLTSTLRADAEALIRRGLIESNALRNLRGTIAYRDIALDLYSLVQVLRASWPKIEGKTAIQLSELNRAESLANRLTLALAAREQAPALVGPAAAMRQRAFTLFMSAYNDVRRAIGYLEPDKVDEIAPHAYVPRGAGKRRVEAQAPEPQPAVPAVTPQNGQPPAVAPALTPSNPDGPYTA